MDISCLIKNDQLIDLLLRNNTLTILNMCSTVYNVSTNRMDIKTQNIKQITVKAGSFRGINA
jgi:hypothetical protein